MVRQPLVPKFDWETSERVDAKFQYMNQGDLVFITFNFKGYNKEQDARYALSENEILLEVRDVAKNKVHRVCKTLAHPIDCQESSVQLLVDYIVFKLKKKNSKTWDDLGYDIAQFSIPESNFYMRSNFLKQKSARVGEDTADKENSSAEANVQKEEVSQSQNKENVEKEKPKEEELTEEAK